MATYPMALATPLRTRKCPQDSYLAAMLHLAMCRAAKAQTLVWQITPASMVNFTSPILQVAQTLIMRTGPAQTKVPTTVCPLTLLRVRLLTRLGFTWTGLSYCNGTSNEWIACSNSAKTVTPNPELCWCPETSRVVAFSESSSIANHAVLPTATGGTISRVDDFTPIYPLSASSTSQSPAPSSSAAASSVPSTASTTSTASSDSQAVTTSRTTSTAAPTSDASSPATSATTTPPTTPQGLSTGAKAGIGVGVGIAGIAILALLIALLQWLARRRQKAKEEQEYEKQLSTPYTDQPTSTGTDEIRSPVWSGHKSELAANDIDSMRSSTIRGRDSMKSEVQGSPAVGGESRAVGNGGYEVPGRMGTVYEMPG